MVFFWGNKKGSSERKKLCFTLFMNPMDGDLKGYCSGKCTLTFQTPPSYGVPLGPKNLTTNSSRPLRMVTSCLLSINLITSVSMRRLPALGDDMVVGFHSVVFFTSSRGGELNWRRSWLGSIADPRKQRTSTGNNFHPDWTPTRVGLRWSSSSVGKILDCSTSSQPSSNTRTLLLRWKNVDGPRKIRVLSLKRERKQGRKGACKWILF